MIFLVAYFDLLAFFAFDGKEILLTPPLIMLLLAFLFFRKYSLTLLSSSNFLFLRERKSCKELTFKQCVNTVISPNLLVSSFVERYSFYRVLDDLPKDMRKPCFSKKFHIKNFGEITLF